MRQQWSSMSTVSIILTAVLLLGCEREGDPFDATCGRCQMPAHQARRNVLYMRMKKMSAIIDSYCQHSLMQVSVVSDSPGHRRFKPLHSESSVSAPNTPTIANLSGGHHTSNCGPSGGAFNCEHLNRGAKGSHGALITQHPTPSLPGSTSQRALT